MKLVLSLFIFAVLKIFPVFAAEKSKVIICDPGLIFFVKEKTLYISMDNNPYEGKLAPYFKRGNYSYIKTGLVWSNTLNSFHVKDQYSTVHLFQYFKKNSARLVAHAPGFPTLSIKFDNCEVTSENRGH